MITLSAGPAGIRLPGQVYELDESDAKALIDGRYAVEYVEPRPAVGRAPETAAGPAQETPEARAPQRRGARRGVAEDDGTGG